MPQVPCISTGKRGIVASCRLCLLPLLTRAFFRKAMGNTIFNIGKVHTINNNDITINTTSANAAEIVRSVIHDHPQPSKPEPEDIQAEDVTQQPQNNLPFLVPKKLEELNLYTLEQFADMYRKAAESDAKTFAMFLKKYRDLKVLDFQGYNKKEIFAAMRNFFPTMRQYSYRNFTDNF